MKTTKSELKSILKECLLELIAEGALNTVINQQQQPQQMMQPQYGNQSWGGYPPPQQPNQQMVNRAQMIAQGAFGGNSQQAKLFENMLLESAMDDEASEMGLVPQSQQGQLQVERQEMKKFGGGAMGRWANLAFNTQPKTLPFLPM
jgi:predicted SAM-dependent methyltransferase